ncbi:methylated-DNA--[protein]-cysteine S-methyltransferase [Marinobacter nanhaiticus D15-8W]|uniref:Methylated-DNA--protein-cysteine methyltransferase n=1 Tax=Marinobacter nanhaiticus D15-8W TaxID=626887 RepID=N6WPP0_9GAMM|nr:methylated-DNA--[protein]-cysteine S-methyltransferase [Marinobacter nanhaiticus]ENO13032.1 methylated-DNA--[protein]-cysteine S-methyltransferase [Marinobacter nanhaiticus D15-8W]BES70386.1 methylated-DNA--[protein]-cysteine S-methyltransferase [Marinobacter nanhaiticus D15-8W]
MTTFYCHTPSPIGELLLTGDGTSLTRIYMRKQKYGCDVKPGWEQDESQFGEARRQLDAYFAGDLKQFDLPLAPAGTEFQQSVWRALVEIPYGETRSYGELARQLGSPKLNRAVGTANGRNPISIIIPCHRVIGADGSLTGYGGGVERKRWLLAHEASNGEYGQFELF